MPRLTSTRSVQPPVARARVEWDRERRVPARVVAHGERFNVTALAGRRDELAAFPADRGPRVTYLLETDRGQASLVFDARRRSWYLEGLTRAA